MSGLYQISGSALLAQRQRLNLIASNLANADSTSSSTGQPYRARFDVFAAQPLQTNGGTDPTGAEGVRVQGVVTSQAPFKKVYAPGNPNANAQGYVIASNVSLVRQMSDLVSATQTYRANLAMLQQGQQIDRALINSL
ncbi:MAG TPA: flagellar basal body rod protein FlgC [Gammaproteobacteria bacterium]|nr:flagellar basal body rod protein FlgC [Gammaproteobacteria bacterium]